MIYGGEGISICKQWLDYQNFKDDMESTWQPSLHLCRNDSSRGYDPRNCVWMRSSEVTGTSRYTDTFRYRNDDVLGPSAQWTLDNKGTGELGRLKQLHAWVEEAWPKIVHVPSILVEDISAYTDAIKFIREETEKGLMLPEIHGLRHIDYAKLETKEIISHLETCKTFIFNEFGRHPKRFMTPWGANAPHIFEAAYEAGVTVVDLSVSQHFDIKIIAKRLREETMNVDNLKGIEGFDHWWSRGARLARICKAIVHGSWREAELHNHKLFR